MKRIKFIMDCGYVGTEKKEIMEFPDDITEEQIEEELQIWFWDNFNGGYRWEDVTD